MCNRERENKESLIYDLKNKYNNIQDIHNKINISYQ